MREKIYRAKNVIEARRIAKRKGLAVRTVQLMEDNKYGKKWMALPKRRR